MQKDRERQTGGDVAHPPLAAKRHRPSPCAAVQGTATHFLSRFAADGFALRERAEWLATANVASGSPEARRRTSNSTTRDIENAKTNPLTASGRNPRRTTLAGLKFTKRSQIMPEFIGFFNVGITDRMSIDVLIPTRYGQRRSASSKAANPSCSPPWSTCEAPLRAKWAPR